MNNALPNVRNVSNISDMYLSAGPLTTAPDDARLYVARPVDERVANALTSEFNVLLGARRGAGTTSMLNRLEGKFPGAVKVNAAAAETYGDILAAVAARADIPRQVFVDLVSAFSRADPLAAPRVLSEMRAALESTSRTLVVLVDGPLSPTISHDLFGRLRDEVFALPVTWLIAAHEDRFADHLTPPADVFFEHLDHIEDVNPASALEILVRREVAGVLPEPIVEAILKHHDGTPRSVVALARAQAGRDPAEVQSALQAHAIATADLTRGAAILLAELQGRGPTSATNVELLSRLGVTDRHLRRSFLELEEAGLVRTLASRGGSPGRPATTYALTDLGAVAGLRS